MSLQNQLISKINRAYGRTNLIKGITNCEKRVHKHHKFYYSNMATYFNDLYINDVDVESHAIEYREISLETIEQLKYDNLHLKNPILEFLIELITYKLDSVHPVMKLA